VFQLFYPGLGGTAITWLAGQNATHAPVEADEPTSLSFKNFSEPTNALKTRKNCLLSVASKSAKQASKILGFAALKCFAWICLEASESGQSCHIAPIHTFAHI
jgi:hypothetical protein